MLPAISYRGFAETVPLFVARCSRPPERPVSPGRSPWPEPSAPQAFSVSGELPATVAKSRAAFRSRSISTSHASHRKTRSDSGISAFTAPQPEHLFVDGKKRDATTNGDPYRSTLYSSMRRNPAHPQSAMDRDRCRFRIPTDMFSASTTDLETWFSPVPLSVCAGSPAAAADAAVEAGQPGRSLPPIARIPLLAAVQPLSVPQSAQGLGQWPRGLAFTIAGFTAAFNAVFRVGWDANEKNGVRLHHLTYRETKGECPNLVSDLLIQARVKATEALRSAFSRRKKGRKLRRSLRRKGTRSEKRHLRRLAGKVKRFRRDCDHVLSRGGVDCVDYGTVIVVENLTHIRARAKRPAGSPAAACTLGPSRNCAACWSTRLRKWAASSWASTPGTHRNAAPAVVTPLGTTAVLKATSPADPAVPASTRTSTALGTSLRSTLPGWVHPTAAGRRPPA